MPRTAASGIDGVGVMPSPSSTGTTRRGKARQPAGAGAARYFGTPIGSAISTRCAPWRPSGDLPARRSDRVHGANVLPPHTVLHFKLLNGGFIRCPPESSVKPPLPRLHEPIWWQRVRADRRRPATAAGELRVVPSPGPPAGTRSIPLAPLLKSSQLPRARVEVVVKSITFGGSGSTNSSHTDGAHCRATLGPCASVRQTTSRRLSGSSHW